MSYFASRASRVVSSIVYLLIAALLGVFTLMLMSGPKSGGLPLGQFVLLLSGPLLLVIAAVTEIFGPRAAACIALAGGVALLVFFISIFHYLGTTVTAIVLSIVGIGSIAYPLVTIVALLRRAPAG